MNYEFNIGNNLATSCARSTTTGELLKCGGDTAVREYLSLPLDYIPVLLLPGSVFGVEHHFRIGFGGNTLKIRVQKILLQASENLRTGLTLSGQGKLARLSRIAF